MCICILPVNKSCINVAVFLRSCSRRAQVGEHPHTCDGPLWVPGAHSAVQQKLLCFVAFAQTTEWSLNVAGADYKIPFLFSSLTPSLLKCFLKNTLGPLMVFEELARKKTFYSKGFRVVYVNGIDWKLSCLGVVSMTVAWDEVQKSFVMLTKCAGKSPSLNFWYT